MKKINRFILIAAALVLMLMSFAGCNPPEITPERVLNEEFLRLTAEEQAAVMDEFERSFNFFWEEANTDPDSPGFGLIPDRWNRLLGRVNMSSIAATGFGLATIAAGVNEGFVTFEEAEERVYGTIRTFDRIQTEAGGNSAYQGMFQHFLNLFTGRREPGWNDVSTIDTALLIAGMLTAGEFFGGRVKEAAKLVYSRVNWAYFVNTHHNNPAMLYRPGTNIRRQWISMGFRPDPNYAGIRPDPEANFIPGRPGLLFNWNWYGEQVILYVLAAGAPNPEFRVNAGPFYDMNRPSGSWGGGNDFIYSFHNSMFVHQFTHAFVDFRGMEDREGIDWFQNSVDASIASWQWTVDNRHLSESFSEVSWGLSAGDFWGGYCGHAGTPPRGWNPGPNNATWLAFQERRGTINTQGALGSIIFTPEKSVGALMHYRTKPELQGEFGLMGGFNMDGRPSGPMAGIPWFSSSVIGIDKGIIAMMFSNFRDDFVQRYFMKSDAAINGLALMEITRV